jgi:hypothetical protein
VFVEIYTKSRTTTKNGMKSPDVEAENHIFNTGIIKEDPRRQAPER